jgi:hypothetical protein
MCESLKFKSGAPTHHKRQVQHCLKRDDHLFPAQVLTDSGRKRGWWASIDPANNLLEPTMFYILAAKRAGIAPALKPSCIN